MNKRLRYTIQAVIEVDAEDGYEILDIMDQLRTSGDAEVTDVEVVEEES